MSGFDFGSLIRDVNGFKGNTDPSIYKDSSGNISVSADPVSVVEKNPFKNMDPRLAEVLTTADEEYQAKYGKPLPITSKTRTRAEQQSLYDRYVKGEKGIYMPLNPSDYPNRELFHQDAVDIGQEVPEDFLKKHGLERKLGDKDPVHTTLINKDDVLGLDTPAAAQAHDDVLGINNGSSGYDFSHLTGANQPGITGVGSNIVPKGGLESLVSGMKTSGAGMTVGIPQLISEATGYNTGSKFFGDTAKSLEAENAPYQKAHPGYNLAGEIIGGAPLAMLPIGDVAEGASIARQGIQALKGGVVAGLAQPVADTDNYWLEKAKQGMFGAVGGPIGYGVTKIGGKVLGAALNKGEEWARQGYGAAKDLIQSFESRGGQVAQNAGDPAVAAAVKAGLPQTLHDAIANASPELKQTIINDVAQGKKIDATILENHLKDDALAHPLQLTKGQATENIGEISKERENKANNGFNVRSNQQNENAVKNVDSFFTEFTPNAKSSGHYDNSVEIIKGLEGKQQKLKEATSKAYQDLQDMNGGQFPIDLSKLQQNIDASLNKTIGRKRAYESDALKDIKADLDEKIAQGHMTFDDYEVLRSDLAEVMRSNVPGKVRDAASTVRTELENLPLSKQGDALKERADTARKLAKFEFDLEDTTGKKYVPAFKALKSNKLNSEEGLGAEKFVNNYIVNGDTAHLNRMINLIGDDPIAMQNVKAAVLQHIKNESISNGTFYQAKYNKALNTLAANKKLDMLFTPDEIVKMRNFGDVAEKAFKLPVGHHVSLSGTGASMRENPQVNEVASNLAAAGVDIAAGGFPVGSVVRKGSKMYNENQAQQASANQIHEMLKPYAGMSKEAAWKQYMRETLPNRAGKVGAYGVGGAGTPIGQNFINVLGQPSKD